MDSGSAYIVLEKYEWYHSGIIEHFDIFKMASKMAANYKLKHCVVWKKCLKPIFSLKVLAMTLESSWRHLAHNKNIKIK